MQDIQRMVNSDSKMREGLTVHSKGVNEGNSVIEW